METAVTVLTNFGDLAVLLPLAVVVAIWLFAMGSWRETIAWIGALGLCMSLTALSKVYFFICSAVPDLQSPSGHTSLSTLVYGGLTLILASESDRRQGLLPVIAGPLFIIGIAVSRLVVDAHTLVEVIIGLGIGLLALGFFARDYVRHRPPRAWLLPLVAIAALLMVVLNGQQVHAEDFLHGIAAFFRPDIQAACA